MTGGPVAFVVHDGRFCPKKTMKRDITSLRLLASILEDDVDQPHLRRHDRSDPVRSWPGHPLHLTTYRNAAHGMMYVFSHDSPLGRPMIEVTFNTDEDVSCRTALRRSGRRRLRAGAMMMWSAANCFESRSALDWNTVRHIRSEDVEGRSQPTWRVR